MKLSEEIDAAEKWKENFGITSEIYEADLAGAWGLVGRRVICAQMTSTVTL